MSVVRANIAEGFRVISFGGKGKRLGEKMKAMCTHLEEDGSMEVYGQTSKNHVNMYQFRPKCKARRKYEYFMQSEQRLSRSDQSTDLRGRQRPPEEINDLVRALDDAYPILGHYEIGWVQINKTNDLHSDELSPHLDLPGWGDLIIVFTTSQIDVYLTNTITKHKKAPGNPQETFRCECKCTVPENTAYVLAGHSRTIARHHAFLSSGRIGVVLRYYLRDLCLIGARDLPEVLPHSHDYASDDESYDPIPTHDTSYTIDRSSIGQEVVARWLSHEAIKTSVNENGGHISAAKHKEHAAMICPYYRSCYPGRLLDIREGPDAVQFCLIKFFEHALDATDGAAEVWLPSEFVLDIRKSTRWFNEAQDPIAASFHERIAGRSTLSQSRARPKPPYTAKTRPPISGSRLNKVSHLSASGRPKRLVQKDDTFCAGTAPSRATSTLKNAYAEDETKRKSLLEPKKKILRVPPGKRRLPRKKLKCVSSYPPPSNDTSESHDVKPLAKKRDRPSDFLLPGNRRRHSVPRKMSGAFDTIPDDHPGGYEASELKAILTAFLKYSDNFRCGWPSDAIFDDPNLPYFFQDKTKLPGRKILFDYITHNYGDMKALAKSQNDDDRVVVQCYMKMALDNMELLSRTRAGRRKAESERV